MSDSKKGFATRAIHLASKEQTGVPGLPMNVPIVQTANFYFESAQEYADVINERADGFCYTRLGNPTNMTFEKTMASLEGGAYLNIGSAVILPEVFLKALTVARNLGHEVNDVLTADFDMIRHYRPRVNVVERPTLKGGSGTHFTGHHEIMIPLLDAALHEALGDRAEAAAGKIVSWDEARAIRERLRAVGATAVFTNGCFDLVHRGHVTYLQKARSLGDALILGLNSDESVRRLKGEGRPILPMDERAFLLAGLEAVDHICVFDEDTPLELIRMLQPDILVKGGDYTLDGIVGREAVEAAGGKVMTVPVVEGRSTTEIVNRIKKGE